MNQYPTYYITTEKEFKKLKTLENVSIECQHCKNTFTSKKKYILSSIKKDNKYIKFCSPKCGQNYINKEANIKLNCTTCNKEIIKLKSSLNESGNNFCSQSCAATHNNSITKRKYKIANCINCNKEFSQTRSTQKTCCILCNMEHKNKNTLASKIIKRIGANAYDCIRQSARNYAKRIMPHKCMNCRI